MLESTAAGRDNYWHKKWLYNLENWPLRQSRLCPLFLPWYVGTDIYPTPTWIHGHPVGEFEEITLKHAARAKDYVQSGQNALVTKFLGTDWEMSPEQMWFWQVTRKEYKANGRLNDFYAELCADDTEAFQSPNTSIFDADLIADYRENRKMPIGVYGIQCPVSEVPVILQARPQDIDHSRPIIPIKCKWGPNQVAHEYNLVPLLHHGPAPFSPEGKIIIYEFPKKGEIYGVGVDTGFGVGKDNSVIQGIRKGTLERNDSQVFEFASSYVNSFNLWPFALALGTLYATPVNGVLKQPKMVIEMAANGENVQNELKKRGWSNFHLLTRPGVQKKSIESNANRLGWFTNSWSRPMMLDMLIDALNAKWLDIHSQWFIDEMASLEIAENKIQAGGATHDDRIMALGIVLYSLHYRDTRNRDKWIVRERMEQSNPNPVYASYSPGSQGKWSELTKDATTSYTYRVVRSSSPDADLLRDAGATLIPSR